MQVRSERKSISKELVFSPAQIVDSIDRLGQLLLDLFKPPFSGGITPSDSLGVIKHRHMRHLCAQAGEMGKLHGLSPHATELLRIVLRGHDLGRHLEAFLPHTTAAKPGQWHSDKSVELLSGRVTGIEELKKLTPRGRLLLETLTTDLLAPLAPDDRTAVQFAIRYHSTREVPALDGTRARAIGYKLCYILRDHDKLDIIRRGTKDEGNPAHDYLDISGRGVWNQIEKFAPQYFAGISVPLGLLSAAAEHIIRGVFAGNPTFPTDPKVPRAELKKLYEGILAYMNGSPREEDLIAFSQQKSLALEARAQSYAGFLLLQSAMLFDIKSPGVFLDIVRDDLLRDRLDFIATRVSYAEFEMILSSLEKVISARSLRPQL